VTGTTGGARAAGGPRWAEAAAAAAELRARPGDRRTLLLLARLPLLPERVLERLAGARGGASLYRGLRRLAGTGLVGAARPGAPPGHAGRLYYLTDLGLAAVALDRGVALAHLARRNRLGGADLLALLPGLPQLLAGYELLAALAAGGPGRPDLLAWERPWRRRYWRATAKAPVTAVLPAYAALAWDRPDAEETEDAEVGEAGAYLLVPDLATYPVRRFRPALDHLLALRVTGDADLPTLVVATSDAGRAEAWRDVLEEARRARAEAPLAACVATWGDLPAGLAPLWRGAAWGRPATGLVRRVRLAHGSPHRPERHLPRLVGDALAPATVPPAGAEPLARLALRLSQTDRALLDVLGRHPFLTAGCLAVLLGSSPPAAGRRRDRLIALGLARLVGYGEAPTVPPPAGDGLVELTVPGLEVVAAQQGLSLSGAVRANGLAGGGPDEPVGPRRRLLRHLAHTVGADDVFVRLAAGAHRRAAVGGDDALLEWRGAAACARGRVRPDGYGLYRHAGRRYGFFLEYDRGTMSARDYRAKFAAYYHYLASGVFERDYDGFPTVLVVTSDPGSERRIAGAVGAAGAGRDPPLPVLLTTTGRVESDRRGLLGPIWREPGRTGRRLWPVPSGGGDSAAVLPALRPRVLPPGPPGARGPGFDRHRPGGPGTVGRRVLEGGDGFEASTGGAQDTR
jgi:hypothetical protein